MLKLIHKYFRRAIVWAQKPSEEELAERERYGFELRLRLELQRLENLPRGRCYGFSIEHRGLSKDGVIRACSALFSIWKRNEDISDSKTQEVCEGLCKLNGMSFTEMVRAGDIQCPFGLTSKDVAA
jgi:hypothetical protein